MSKMRLTSALLIAAIICFAPSLSAQTGVTAVTAIVQDPTGNLYTNAPYSVTFFDPGTSGKLPTLNGSPFQRTFVGANTDSFGNLAVTVADNNVIASTSGATNTQWRFSICAQAGTPCFSTLITITGASQDITATLKSSAAPLSTTGERLLNAQGPKAPITGTGAEAVMYTYTIPASTVFNLKGVRLVTSATHSTGGASVTYNIRLNGLSIFQSVSSGGPLVWYMTAIRTSATNGSISGMAQITGNSLSVADQAGLAWGSDQVLQLGFTVAATDAITPIGWSVELVN